MNRDFILKSAIDAGALLNEVGAYLMSAEDLERFAALVETAVRADEREECARVCDEVEDQAWAQWKAAYNPIDQGRSIGAEECAFAIRARGNNEPT